MVCEIELDEYQILYLTNKENITDFVDIINQQIDQWVTIPVIVTVKHLVCETKNSKPL